MTFLKAILYSLYMHNNTCLLGIKQWRKAMGLKDAAAKMLFGRQDVLACILNYVFLWWQEDREGDGFISLNIYEMAEKTEMFPCKDLKKVLNLFRLKNEGKPFLKAMLDRDLKVMNREAAIVCALFLGLKIRIDDDEEVDMCKAIIDLQWQWKRQARKEG